MTQLSMEARALIERVGLADGPGAERRARVKRRLVAALATASMGVGGVASAATASAHAGAAGVALGGAAGKSALTLGSVAIWLAAGAGLGTLVSTPALVSRLQAARERPAVIQSAPFAQPVVPAEQLPLAAEPQAEPPPATVSTAQPALGRGAQLPASKLAAPAPVATLADETRLLERAQRELAAGRPAEALSLLDEHARAFPEGALGEERSAARVLSLCALGRVEEAKRAAAAFLASSAHSPLIPRLRGSCALLESGDPAYTR